MSNFHHDCPYLTGVGERDGLETGFVIINAEGICWYKKKQRDTRPVSTIAGGGLNDLPIQSMVILTDSCFRRVLSLISIDHQEFLQEV
jgi:hypothetical protein